MDSVFGRVKASIASQADAILKQHGVKNHRGEVRISGEWTTGYLCPFCGDRSGSASFTPELFIRCHQCSYKADVFTWIARHTGSKEWDVCKELAEQCGVSLKTKATRKDALAGRQMPYRMTEEILEHAVRDLWENEGAAASRAMLAERGLDDQRLLMELEVGWIRGWVIFTRRDENGNLTERYRGWNPKDQKVKWRWFGQGSGGVGIWPGRPAADGVKILLCEGESDVLTAMARLRMHEQGWHVATWTAGATSCFKPRDIPKSWFGKEVHVAYDNDVFQGPDYKAYVVQAKPGKSLDDARRAAEHRLRNLIEKVCPTLRGLNCEVFVRQCPVSPTEHYGGDLRDWVSAGGLDFETDWKKYSLKELPKFGPNVEAVDYDDAFHSLGKTIKTQTQVDMIGRDDVLLPRIAKMECQLGQHPICAMCPGHQQFPDGIIDMNDYPRERVVAIESGIPSEWLARHVVQRPKGCPRLEIVIQESTTASVWHGMRPGRSENTAQRTLHIISDQPPSLSGEVEVTGAIVNNSKGTGVVMHATKVVSLDKSDIDMGPYVNEFIHRMPCFSDRVEHIDEYLEDRWRDLAYNVTRIHGRKDIQIAHDLLAHSAIDLFIDGAYQRGWLDICVFGETRSGKSLTFRRMFDHHKLGLYHTAVSNVSRAGLIMGADNHGLLKPGLLPKCNRKMLMMDEWHFLCANAIRANQDHPMSWMQSARDEGKVSGIKIYGNRDLPAKVRLCMIANWIRNKRRTFEFPCEHILALYGSPETVSRLDFALPVGPVPTQQTLDFSEHFWTPDRTRALALRAWSQDTDDIVIEPEAIQEAKARSRSWADVYDSETIPLFTPEEKWVSVIRIAVACANLTFSHVKGQFEKVHVRPVHVEWAVGWLEHVWQEAGYDAYSQSRLASQTIDRRFEAEKRMSVDLGLEDPIIAENTLSQFLEPFTLQDLVAITGRELRDTIAWISRMQAIRVFERVKYSGGNQTQFCTTRGGDKMIGNMLKYARHDHKGWVDRYRRLNQWMGPSEPDGMVPMTSDTWQIFDSDDDSKRQAIPF